MDKEPNATGERAPVDWKEFVGAWIAAIKQSSDEEQDWRKKAQEAVDLYRGGGSEARESVFNIYHANVEVLAPALYNSTPAPDVRRRYLDQDPVGKDSAQILERALYYSVDIYDFDDLMRQCVLDAINVSRGVARVRYEPTLDPEMGVKVDEKCRCDYVPWKSFRRGPARMWPDVPWVAFEHFLPREEIERLNPDIVERLKYAYSPAGKDEDGERRDRDGGQSRRAHVWEIWDKDTRRVIFLSPDHQDEPIAVLDDPLGLSGFFPVPRPMQMLRDTGNLTPVTLLSTYKHLIDELEQVSRRILSLVKQVRVRGGFAGASLDLAAIVNADDGELVPLTSADMALSTSAGGIEKLITWFPIEPTIKAIAELMMAREAIKQQIYEVTGIADIIRGATKATETATAQQLKAQFGSVRIQSHQAEVARFARDLLRLKAEIIAEKFEPETLGRMTGVEARPEVVNLIRDDLMRGYRIDIETDSTIRGDMMRNQEQMALFLQGTAQYLQAVGPMVQEGVMPAAAAVNIFAAFARSFKLGKQAEDTLEQLAQQAGQAQAGGPRAAQMQQERAELALREKEAMARIEIEKGKLGAKMQADAMKSQAEQQRAQIDKMRLDLDMAQAMAQPADPGAVQ